MAASAMTGLHREVGALDARIAALEGDIAELRADVRVIRDVLVSLKGGWRILTIMVAISASIGAGLARLSDMWH